MSTLEVTNWKGSKVGKIDLDPEVFDLEVREDLLHLAIRWQLAKRRQGTHMTKTKGLVSGGGKKPFKQKGTGNARQGSTRSPLMPGGGTAFGPEPRSYSFKVPKSTRRLMLASALSYLHKEGKLMVLEDVRSVSGKTKDYYSSLKAMGVEKAVVLDAEVHLGTRQAMNNLRFYKYLPVEGANVFDLLKYETAIVSQAAIEGLTKRCKAGVE